MRLSRVRSALGLRRVGPTAPSRRSRFRKLLSEQLEDRNLLAALTVTTPIDVVLNGDGYLSLREAMLVANDNTGATSYDGVSSSDVADVIVFADSLLDPTNG